MPVIATKKELQKHLSSLPQQNTLGLVPTMGALHQGHAALIEKAIAENSEVVVSIFVNPTQFDNEEDLQKYPNTFDADVVLLHSISDEIIVFAPSAEEIYDQKVESKTYDFGRLDRVMEGAFRNGHFNGVATIVERLLQVVNPDRAYFGEKDFQQLQIIRELVGQNDIPVEIIGCPIVRETNGLAMSSRNGRLPEDLWQKASFIYGILRTAKKEFGTKSAQHVIEEAKAEFEQHPEMQLEYFSIADGETLEPIEKKQPGIKYRAFVAVYISGVRLIDNIALN